MHAKTSIDLSIYLVFHLYNLATITVYTCKSLYGHLHLHTHGYLHSDTPVHTDTLHRHTRNHRHTHIQAQTKKSYTS